MAQLEATIKSPQAAEEVPTPALAGDDTRIPVMSLTLAQLQEKVQEMGLEKFRAGQIFRWVYTRGATSFDVMTDLKASVRERLESEFRLTGPKVRTASVSTDGTRKWLVEVAPKPGKGEVVETVFIPMVGVPSVYSASLPSPTSHLYRDASSLLEDEGERGSVCVSSQIGCSLKCAFCRTGTMPKSELRSLTSDEIVGQVMLAKREMGDFFPVWTPKTAPYSSSSSQQRQQRNDNDNDSDMIPASLLTSPTASQDDTGAGGRLRYPSPAVTNVVMMGMGEPGYNYRHVKAALAVMLDPNGIALSKRRVTVSTSGVVPVIDRLGEELSVNLAISLHAVRDELRDVLVPINKTFPIATLMEACRRYPGVKNSRVVTWEYVMLDGVNDSIADAKELVRLLKGIPSLVNLIPFNPWPGSRFQTSSMNQIRRFQQVVLEEGQGLLKCSVRTPRGRDILAACGQLAVVNNANKHLPNSETTASSSIASPCSQPPLPTSSLVTG